jgi:hypothetical protein
VQSPPQQTYYKAHHCLGNEGENPGENGKQEMKERLESEGIENRFSARG